ncbi:MFS transporter [Azospirillum rugosum]|uniref:MFS family permease n=1 Tax=Azospirillum rugosum TaxID=416170 RepID=A0ABS4SL28_9PROT|nr:MFS transporter [Azospirillum rugosum]MBP2292793.1 MFS family permease [Azospirillum rugosum]MDQ0527052.1 MFS family permease [Azospirillum rugosum]
MSVRPSPAGAIPGTVVALGFVSLFMDVSSEMIHSLLPVFLVSGLGASALSVGIIEGIAEATASITKVFSGVVSDWVGRRKPLLLLGYGMAALTKPVFPLADSLGTVLLARFLDRIGKGVRGAPRDALVAEVTPVELRGAAFGLRQSMDTVGAFAGPALAMLLMLLSGGDVRLVFWVAVIPAMVAVAVIVVGVREPDAEPSAEKRRFPIRRSELRQLDGHYWGIVALASALTLARFSEAFLLLRAQSVGVEDAYAPLVLIVMNIVYAASAYPLGRLADRLDRRTLLAVGVGLLVLADLVLAAAGSVWAVLAGSAAWGLHMGATQGLLAVFVADAAPKHLRGTAFGLYSLVTGLALLAASALAGALWTAAGPAATFLAGAGFSVLSLVGLLMLVPGKTEAGA